MNINSRTSKVNFTGFVSGAIASFTGLRQAPTKVKVNAIGVSECNVIWCGKNLLNTTGLVYAPPSSTTGSTDTKRTFIPNTWCTNLFQNNQYNPNGVSSSNVTTNHITFVLSTGGHGVQIPLTNLKAGLTYRISFTGTGVAFRALFYKKDGTFISNATTNAFIVPDETYYSLMSFIGSTVNTEYNVTNIQLEVGSTATAYETYTSTSYIISVGQTVTQIDQRIGVNNIFVDDENVDDGTVEVYYVTV